MSWTRWILGTGLAMACTISAPSVSWAATHHPHHPGSHHHHVKKGLLPRLPITGMVRVYHGEYSGTTWPTLPGTISLRQVDGQTVAIAVTDTTRIAFIATGEVGDLIHAMAKGRLLLTVVAIKEHDGWVAEIITAHLTGAAPVHPVPLPVAPSSSTARSGSAS